MSTSSAKTPSSESDRDPIGSGAFVSASRAESISVPGLEHLTLTERSAAATAVRQILQVADRGSVNEKAKVILNVRTEGFESLEVQVTWKDGVIHALFLTESGVMRNALSREWDLWMPFAREKGMQFADPSFAARDHAHGRSDGQNDGDRASNRGAPNLGLSGILGSARRGFGRSLSPILPIDPPHTLPQGALRAWA